MKYFFYLSLSWKISHWHFQLLLFSTFWCLAGGTPFHIASLSVTDLQRVRFDTQFLWEFSSWGQWQKSEGRLSVYRQCLLVPKFVRYSHLVLPPRSSSSFYLLVFISYWVGHKVHLGVSVTPQRKTQTLWPTQYNLSFNIVNTKNIYILYLLPWFTLIDSKRWKSILYFLTRLLYF